MIFQNLSATNWGPFSEIDYDFKEHPVLIQGENLTDDSQESNGSGKSKIQEAIEYCLFKTTASGVKDIDLIQFGQENSRVVLTIWCAVRKEQLRITRLVKSKGSSELAIAINDVDQSFATVNDGNKLILSWIGISAEDLQNYYIINKERYKSFFSSSNREKMEMINRFSNAKMIDGVDVFVQEDVAKLDNELKGYKSLETASESKISTLKEQIDYENSRDFEAETKAEIAKIEEKIEDIDELIDGHLHDIEEIERDKPRKLNAISDYREAIKEKAEKIETISVKLKELDSINFNTEIAELNDKLEGVVSDKLKVKKDLSKTDLEVREVEEILIEINKNIKGSVKCPKCSHQFLIGDPKVSIEDELIAKVDTEALLKRMKENVETINNKLKTIQDTYDKVDAEKIEFLVKERSIADERRKIVNVISILENDSLDLQKLIGRIERDINDLATKANNIKNAIESLTLKKETLANDIVNMKVKTVDQARIDELNGLIRAEEKKLSDIKHSIERKESEIFNTTQWITNFKKFNMYLANQSLKIIQGYCNKFLADIKSDIQIKWDGVKMLSNGKLKEEISATIIRDGVYRDFWSFSGGERGRMDYSMIMTMQTMINKTNKYGGLEFLSTDEIAEGIDAKGLSDLMKSLERFGKTILITTHVTSKNVSDKVMLVRKSNRISTIVNN